MVGSWAVESLVGIDVLVRVGINVPVTRGFGDAVCIGDANGDGKAFHQPSASVGSGVPVWIVGACHDRITGSGGRTCNTALAIKTTSDTPNKVMGSRALTA